MYRYEKTRIKEWEHETIHVWTCFGYLKALFIDFARQSEVATKNFETSKSQHMSTVYCTMAFFRGCLKIVDQQGTMVMINVTGIYT